MAMQLPGGILAALQNYKAGGGFKPSAFSGGPAKPLQPVAYSPYKFDPAGYAQPAGPMAGKPMPADGGGTPFTSYAQPDSVGGLSPNAQPSSLGGVGVGVPIPATSFASTGGATDLSQNAQLSSLGGVGYTPPVVKLGPSDGPGFHEYKPPMPPVPGGLSSLQAGAAQALNPNAPSSQTLAMIQSRRRMNPNPIVRPY